MQIERGRCAVLGVEGVVGSCRSHIVEISECSVACQLKNNSNNTTQYNQGRE
jgi:hypothetical protein